METEQLSAAEKARIRRERREARILAGGADRLNKITSAAQSHKTHKPIATVYDDPPDISPDLAMPSFRRSSSSTQPENPIFKLLAAGRQLNNPGESSPGPQNPDMGFEEFIKAAMPGGAEGSAGFDMLAAMMQQNAAGESTTIPVTVSDHPRYWRSAHTFAVITLALYAILTLNVTGTQMARLESLGNGNSAIFWYFTTIELVLQSSRFFIEQGRSPSSSIFTKIAAYVPVPYSSYLLLAGRYTHIITNIVKDFCLLVFILGLNAWWCSD